jgi:hypothetical protein
MGQPLIYRFRYPDSPLPTRRIEARAALPADLPGFKAPPWLWTGDASTPFDFTACIRPLVRDISRRCPALGHLDESRMLFGVTQARGAKMFGLQARVTPLRFARGQLTQERRGVTFQVQRYLNGSVEFLYLVTFCLPRFQDQAFDDKMVTLFHELYHVSPAFDGDLRRHSGRYCIHSASQQRYDAHMADLARAYLSTKPDPRLLDFLRLSFGQLVQRHGSVVGVAVPRPKMVPVGQTAASRGGATPRHSSSS